VRRTYLLHQAGVVLLCACGGAAGAGSGAGPTAADTVDGIDVTAGRELYRERPVLAADGAVLSMPQRTFIGRLGYRIRPDHVYRITAIYDNPTSVTIRAGAMGSIGGVVRTRAGAWPEADPGHPLYIEDLRILTYGLDDDSHGGHGNDHGAHGAH
jgi:hypothetical protein